MPEPCMYIMTSPSGRSYVGVTKQRLKDRMWQHNRDSKSRGSRPIVRALRKYGLDNFDVRPLVYGDLDYLYGLEEAAIQVLAPEGYNAASGGLHNWRHTVESRDKIRAASKARWEKSEYRNMMIAVSSRPGHMDEARAARHTPEIGAKQGKKMTKLWADPAYNTRVGALISEAKKGVAISDVERQRRQTPEYRAQCRAAANRRWNKEK